jgi:hypothetical protein
LTKKFYWNKNYTTNFSFLLGWWGHLAFRRTIDLANWSANPW